MRRTGVLTISDGCAKGEREDISGAVLANGLAEAGFDVVQKAIVPDEREIIAATLRDWCDSGCDLILTTGGTGFAPRDITPEATRDVLERDIPGFSEILRTTGYANFPRAILSRGVSGLRGRTIIINLPGSPGGVRDGLKVLLPLLPHAVSIAKDEPVDHTPIPKSVIPVDSTPTTIAVLETNLDDFSPEFYEPLMERLFAAGALDVTLSAVQMKKNRPGTQLTVLAPIEKREALAKIVFTETTTLGIRHTTMERYVLTRRSETIETPYGPVRLKIGVWQGTETTASPEYDDVKAAALTHNVPVKTVYLAALRAARPAGETRTEG